MYLDQVKQWKIAGGGMSSSSPVLEQEPHSPSFHEELSSPLNISLECSPTLNT